MAAPVRLVSLGSVALRVYPLAKDKITVGTAADNDLVIEHNSVSRRHAEIIRRFGRFRVRDLGSRNGTRLNGRAIRGTHRVLPGDELEFGAVRFAVMNSPRRRGLGAPSVLALAAGLAILGFGLSQYLRQHGLRLPMVSWPAASRPSPAAQGTAITSARSPSVAAPETKPEAPSPIAAGPAAPVAEPNGAAQWLKLINHYRAIAGLPPVHEDPVLSGGGFAHARYMVKNNGPMIRSGMLGANIHTEDPTKPWYSEEGLRAARSSDVEQWWGSRPGSRPPAGWAIDEWMASTWHRMALLNPRLREVGYGEYCERGTCSAVLDVLSRLGAGAFAAAAAPAPIAFPPDGASLRIAALGHEWPDPLSSCRGFTIPAGLPITLQLGTMVPARLSAFSLRRGAGSETLEACGYDASTYVNPSGADQERVDDAMHTFGAVVVIPREPLEPGNYTVEMTVNGHSYRWRFTIEGDDSG